MDRAGQATPDRLMHFSSLSPIESVDQPLRRRDPPDVPIVGHDFIVEPLHVPKLIADSRRQCRSHAERAMGANEVVNADVQRGRSRKVLQLLREARAEPRELRVGSVLI